MPRKKGVEYTTDLHVRLRLEERESLQEKANDLGLTVSQVARLILVKQMKGEEQVDPVSEKQAVFFISQRMQSVKELFKKINSETRRFVEAYERSLVMTDRNGNPSVNDANTIRYASTLIKNQLILQNGLNEIIRYTNGAEVHVAALPRVDTAVGKYIQDNKYAFLEETATPVQKDSVIILGDSRGSQESEVDTIPKEFRNMFTVQGNATIIEKAEIYNADSKYPRIRLKVEIEVYRNRSSSKYIVDATDFKSRYENVLDKMVPGREVLINGDLDFATYRYNGVDSDASATIEIKSFAMLPDKAQRE